MTLQKRKFKSTVKIGTQISAQSYGSFGAMVEYSFQNKMIVGSILIAVTESSDSPPLSSNKILNMETTKGCGFNLKFVRDMTKSYRKVHCKDKYSHLSSII